MSVSLWKFFKEIKTKINKQNYNLPLFSSVPIRCSGNVVTLKIVNYTLKKIIKKIIFSTEISRLSHSNNYTLMGKLLLTHLPLNIYFECQ